MSDFDPDEYLQQPPANPATPQPPVAPIAEPDTSAEPSDFDPDQYLNQKTADDYKKLDDQYGTPLELAKTVVEGLGKGLAGPIFTGAETKLLGNEKEQLARQEASPVVHGAAEMTGLVGGAMAAPEITLGGLLPKAGALGAEALGLGAVSAGQKAYNAAKLAGATMETANAAKTAALAAFSAPARIGSAVVASALENMAYQAGDEASKMIVKDPGQSANTAIASMGLAGLIGGAFGTVAPLWHAASGKPTGGILGAIADKLGGIEGVAPNPGAEAIAKSGINISPELKGLVSDNPAVQEMARTLMQTDANASGQAMQKSYKEMTNNAGEHLLNAVGKTAEDVSNMPELSKYEAGKAVGSALADEYEAQMGPLAKGFDAIKSKLKGIDLLPQTQELPGIPGNPGTVNSIIDNIAKKAIEEGWTASPSSDIMREVRRVTEELPLQKNLKNLGDFITQVGNNTNKDVMNGPLRRAGAIMSGVMRDAEADVMAARLGETEGPAAVEEFKALRAGYRNQSALKEAIDSRLNLRGSASGYAGSLKEMAKTDGEGLIRKLAGKGDADWLKFVQTNYPKTAEALKNFHLNDLLQSAASKAKDGAAIDNAAFLKGLSNMTPELRDFVIPKEAQDNILGIKTALDAFKNPTHNFSNTARVAATLLKDLPSTALGAGAMLTGHGFAKSALAFALAKAGIKDAPDAIRLGLLRFLGSNQPVEAGAFKTMVDFLHHTIKGENLLANATKNVFKAGSEVIPEGFMPKESDREKLHKSLTAMQDDPKKALSMAGNTGYYLPNHAAALSQTGANAINFLNQEKPDTGPMAPLDSKRQLSPVEKAQYNRTLDVAQQPLMVFKHIKNGTLTPNDVKVVKTLYPDLYNRSVQKLTDHMTNTLAKGDKIPYSTRLGLSLYMGQALDSTMSPNAIVAAQPMPKALPQPQTATQPASRPKTSTSGLNKMPNMYKTQAQSAEQDRSNRK